MSYDKAPEINDPEPESRKRFLLIGIVTAGLLLGGGSWYWLAKVVGPERPTGLGASAANQTKELVARLEQIAVRLATLSGQPESAERLQLLEEAVAGEQVLLRARPTKLGANGQRLHDWQIQLDTGRGREKSLTIERMEKESQMKGGRPEVSLVQAKEALRLQREVNGSDAAAEVKDYAREERLGQMLLHWEAVPLNAQMTAALKQAQAAMQVENWTEALEAYRAARKLQLRLNQDYSRTPYSDLAAIECIDTEVVSLSAVGLHVQVDSTLRQARAAATAGQEEGAANLFQRSATLQKKLNEQYSRSRFVSMELLRQIEVEEHTIRAAATERELRAIDQRVAAHLRRRETFQVQKDVRAGLEKLEALAAGLPRARGLDEELRLRLNYLALRQEELAKIQDQVYGLLVPFPGAGKISLLKTEVPQALYAMVMNSNPSRNLGRTLPVDSVNYTEAQEFCRRLHWIMGVRVRLPSESEFRQALGNLNEARPFAAWSVENSSGHSQPTGQKAASETGFHDLLGNVSEWLSEDASAPPAVTATRAGGSYTSGAATLAAGPVERAPRTERSRTTGFRIMVEIDLAAP